MFFCWIGASQEWLVYLFISMALMYSSACRDEGFHSLFIIIVLYLTVAGGCFRCCSWKSTAMYKIRGERGGMMCQKKKSDDLTKWTMKASFSNLALFQKSERHSHLLEQEKQETITCVTLTYFEPLSVRQMMTREFKIF